MQSFREFFSAWNGRPNNFDGAFGNQCVDLAKQYYQDVLDIAPGHGNAVEYWDNYDRSKFDRITNTPSFVPQEGDVCIWGKGVSGGLGHIAIFKTGGVNSFQSFDQNWPVGSPCHLQNHDYKNFLGVLRPKSLGQFSVVVTASTLNVRSAPSTKGNVTGSFTIGAPLAITDTVTGDNVNGNTSWYRLKVGGPASYVSAYWTKKI